MKITIECPDLSKYPALENFLKKKDKYILDENRNVIPADTLEWGQFFENTEDRIVKQEEVDGYWISTVFLGIDHKFCLYETENYKPHIFETMIFKGKGGDENYCDRYSTWQEAEEGHLKAIEWVKNGCKEECDECDGEGKLWPEGTIGYNRCNKCEGRGYIRP